MKNTLWPNLMWKFSIRKVAFFIPAIEGYLPLVAALWAVARRGWLFCRRGARLRRHAASLVIYISPAHWRTHRLTGELAGVMGNLPHRQSIVQNKNQTPGTAMHEAGCMTLWVDARG